MFLLSSFSIILLLFLYIYCCKYILLSILKYSQLSNKKFPIKYLLVTVNNGIKLPKSLFPIATYDKEKKQFISIISYQMTILLLNIYTYKHITHQLTQTNTFMFIHMHTRCILSVAIILAETIPAFISF